MSPKNMQEAVADEKTVKCENRSILAKIIGGKMPNIALNSAFILCCSLIIMVIIITLSLRDNTLTLEIVKAIIPVISMSLGYMFGKRDSEKN